MNDSKLEVNENGFDLRMKKHIKLARKQQQLNNGGSENERKCRKNEKQVYLLRQY
jgi:uncharacterized protein YeeX (DUF496 family)